MTITVFKLIKELEKIENKFLEVEIALTDKQTLEPSIQAIHAVKGKVLIFLERKK
jgi:hypothetical protein